MAQAGLTVRGTSQAGGKPEHSDPTIRIRCGGSSTDKSYSRDNRLVPPKSSYRRRSSAPRCRLTLARRWRSCQAFGCSPIKKVRELGSDRGEVLLYTYIYICTFYDFSTVWIPERKNFCKKKQTVLIGNNHVALKFILHVTSRRQYVEILIEKLTYIGEILSWVYRRRITPRESLFV